MPKYTGEIHKLRKSENLRLFLAVSEGSSSDIRGSFATPTIPTSVLYVRPLRFGVALNKVAPPPKE